MRRSLGVNLGEIRGNTAATAKEWAGSFWESPSQEETQQLKGKLYVITSLSLQSQVNLAEILQSMFDALRQEYYQNTEDSVLKSLEKAVRKGLYFIQTFIQQKGVSSETVDFNLSAAVLWGNVLYLGQAGSAKTGLLREGQLKLIGEKITETQPAHSAGSSIRMASGLIREKDFLILGSPQFWEAFTSTKIETNLLGYPLTQALKLMEEKLELYPQKNIVAGLVLNFEIKIFPTEEESIVMLMPEGTEKPRSLAAMFRTVRENIRAALKKKKRKWINPIAGLTRIPVENNEAESQRAQVKPRAFTAALSSKLEGLRAKLKKLRESLGAGLIQLISKLKKLVTRDDQNVQSPEVYLRKPLSLPSNRYLILAAALIIVLGLSIFFSVSHKSNTESKKKYTTAITQIQNDLRDSKRVSLTEAEKQEKLQEADRLLKEMASLKLSAAETQEVNNLKTQVENQIYKIEVVVEKRTVVDFVSIEKEAKPAGLTNFEDKFYLIDTEKNQLYQINNANQTGKTIPIETKKYGKPSMITSNDEGVFLFSANTGLSKFNAQKEEFSLVIEPEEGWNQVNALTSFSANLYLLSPVQKQIIKYVPVANGYSGAINFITETPGDEFLSNTALAIDGAVYTINPSGQVTQFVAGRKKDFSLKGFSLGFKQAQAIFTQEQFKQIYVFDSALKGVAIFAKDGTYQRMLQNPEWNNLKALWVDNKEENLYLLNGTKLIEVSLK